MLVAYNYSCSSLGLIAVRTISCGNLKWFRHSPSIDGPLLFQFRNILSSVAVKSMGDIASLCRTPLVVENSGGTIT